MFEPKTTQPRASSGGTGEFVEGRARLLLPPHVGGKSGVFFNPRMGMNRDIAMLFALSHFFPSRQLRVCDPMTASGVRAVRYVLETSNVLHVLAADSESSPVETARRTVDLNGLAGKISVVQSEANLLLLNHVTERFDLVDLDPFGSPAPYFENTLRATVDGGVIAATATDMGPLTGARAPACIRRYGVRPVRSEFEKEMAIRILAGCLVMIGGRLELGVEIAFSHASDHYARIYAKVSKGRRSANLSAKSLGFLEYCPECLRRNTQSKLESVRTFCVDCGGSVRVGGPIWLGSIWDPQTVQGMIEHTPGLQSSRLSEIQNILTCICEEQSSSPFHYRTDAFSRRLVCRPPALKQVLATLQEAGFEATRTHFSPNGFRTNAPCRDIASLFQDLTKEL
jgi:tRNA (guanine26-N2/guanine27-N2)-dimethyltransferase